VVDRRAHRTRRTFLRRRALPRRAALTRKPGQVLVEVELDPGGNMNDHL
jgi:hypothetical protein